MSVWKNRTAALAAKIKAVADAKAAAEAARVRLAVQAFPLRYMNKRCTTEDLLKPAPQSFWLDDMIGGTSLYTYQDAMMLKQHWALPTLSKSSHSIGDAIADAAIAGPKHTPRMYSCVSPKLYADFEKILGEKKGRSK